MARSGVEIIRLLPHSLGEWMLCPGFSISDEAFHFIAPYCMRWMMANVPHEVSEQYVL